MNDKRESDFTEFGSALDNDAFVELSSDIGQEEMAEALQAYYDETVPRLQKLRAADFVADRALIVHEAHAIKGTSSTFGFTRLSRMAAWLERNACALSMPQYVAMVDELDRAFLEGQAAVLISMGKIA